MNRPALMRALFASAIQRDADVAPILAPLHADFAAYAAPHPPTARSTWGAAAAASPG